MDVITFLKTINTEDIKFKFDFKASLTLPRIAEIEKQLQIKLPQDLVDFYSYTNGIEGHDWIFNIIPLENITKYKDSAGPLLEFAEYMIYSEICLLEIEKDNSSYKFFIARDKVITDSIIEFIKIYCNEGVLGIFGK
jgi:hypothetical protein